MKKCFILDEFYTPIKMLTLRDLEAYLKVKDYMEETISVSKN